MKKVCIDKGTTVFEELYCSLPPFLQRHSEMVSKYSVLLVQSVVDAGIYKNDSSFTPELLEYIGEAAYWHDIGKAEITNDIWEQPRPLTNQEYALVKTHTVLGAAMLEGKIGLVDELDSDQIHSDQVGLTKKACMYHHERWDGKGYPCGFKMCEIPLAGRIVALADAYDSMIASRPYSNSMPEQEAQAEILRCAGTQFDPILASVFVQALNKQTEGVLCAS